MYVLDALINKSEHLPKKDFIYVTLLIESGGTITYSYIHTYIHTHIHTYTHTYMHTYSDKCIHTYTHTYIHTDDSGKNYNQYNSLAQKGFYICDIPDRVWGRDFIFLHTHIHTYTHTHINAYIHTHTHIHAYILR